jgi:limonene 1,2-monooxygenase
MDSRLRFGIFLAPFHPVEDNPTLCLERDLELVEWLDRLGYDEAWIGEHHSAGYEIIASPELFIAAAAERTKRIRLGTGVVSLPYHNPLMVAGRINQLDHMTRGRAMLGVGPGLLPSDAFMLGIDPRKQREMMDESLGVILPLLRGETVTHQSDWFTLKNARVQLLPFTRPHLEVAVASSVSPSGPRTAGKYGIGMLAVGATRADGFNALAHNWGICEEMAARHGQTVDRARWRLAGPVHVAESREQARRNVRFGLERWLHYFQTIGGSLIAQQTLPQEMQRQGLAAAAAQSGGDPVDALIESGNAVVGTPDDAIAQIERLEKQSSGFGCFLQIVHEWADREATRKSYELFARYVTPRFQGSNEARRASLEWAGENRDTFIGAAVQGIMEAIQKHAAEQAERGKK